MMQNFITERRRQARWFKFRLKCYGFLALTALVAIGVIYAVKETKFLKVQQFEISGINAEDSRKFLAELTPRIFKNPLARFLGVENYFSWPSQLDFSDSDIASLDIKKDFINRKVTITLKERKRLGIWCQRFFPEAGAENSKCLWFDEQDGALLGEASDARGQIVPVIWEAISNDGDASSVFMSEISFGNFKKIIEGARSLNLILKNAEYKRDLEELRLITREGAELIFSLRFDPLESVFPAFAKLLETNPLVRVNYINMTVENKIYLKNR